MTLNAPAIAAPAETALIERVPLPKAYRLLNHGPTVLVTAAHGDERNVMAAAWNMALNFEPAQVAVVLDKSTVTRSLIETSGRFALNVPSRAIAPATLAVGRVSLRDIDRQRHRDKFDALDLSTFGGDDPSLPLVRGCVAWLECRVIREPANEQRYDLFIGEVTAAWADARVFANGHWLYSGTTPDALRTLHYVAGGSFLTAGNAIDVAPATPR